jgi:hypothetical protein
LRIKEWPLLPIGREKNNKQIGEETPWWSRERETGSEKKN